ncbi:DUF3667 domain-containing protein [Wenzhouxiangella sp. AB-CW3]|uniref:DUF3667 domain-containing protein n=1 Tax=Wenzhouxiangella sp. AB-CW3 TaxID=2771012 RepID=UPI00168B9B0D|nr:DUF3667 domain-containing protein [Wenzhouxiangella sp. AB-CW3]QOC22408.1 DUF3667 domain-containing protein [Wenzhouxiangella sp. AB-CW3]
MANALGGQGDVSLREYLAEFAEAAVNLEGRFWGSLRALLFRPGLLTSEYMAGRRVGWMRPLHLFLLINLLFFLLSAGWTTFSTPLQVHMTSGTFPHRAVALDWVNRELNDPRLEAETWSELVTAGGDVELDETTEAALDRLVDYAREFNRRSEITARSLVIVLVPMATLFPLLAFCRRRESVVKHLVFTTHWTAVMVLFSLVGGWLTIAAIYAGLIEPGRDDLMASSISLSLILAWSTISFCRAYGLGRVRAVLAAVGMTLWLTVFLQIYRAILFFVVFWTL